MRRHSRTGIFPVLFFIQLFLGAPSVAAAQFTVRSWLTWRTVETEHFVFHYPTPLEAWTRALAARAESINRNVYRVVGYVPTEKTQVIVDDPYAMSNGSAWPFLDQPVIYLWASPPDPRSDIGEFRGWGETLLSHEFTHIAHLTRPSRNDRLRRFWQLSPVDLGPIPLNAPRWVIEGYATLSEGRVTGSGRPHGAWRPAFLREWALEGQLPRYDQLSNYGGYEGGEFAYLAGSAFLEWLQQRQGDSSLVFLWRRMTAKQPRGFDEAFVGVFGESARTLYGRFTTELTGKSIDVERRLRASFPADTGDIVQRLSLGTGDPAISRDGRRVAIELPSQTSTGRIVIWATRPEPDTARARRDSLLRKSDPEDVPARTIYPPAKRVLASLRPKAGAAYEAPRFLADGRVLLDRYVGSGDGTLTPDLFLWDPQHRDVRRVTHNASIRLADPSPDGRSALGMRCIHGWCDVARVDLATGEATAVAEGSPDVSYYRPRYSPDGTRFVASRSANGRWQLAIGSLSSSGISMVPITGNAYDATWDGTNAIVFTTDIDGIPNLARVDLMTGQLTTLTHVTGAAVAPEPSRADSSYWFLSLYSRGYDLRRVRAGRGEVPAALADARALSPVVAQAPEPGMPIDSSAIPLSRPFGLRPRASRWVPIPQIDADGVAAGLTYTSSDLIGKSQIIGRLMFGQRAEWRGGSLDGVWRGSRPFLRGSLFDVAQDQRHSASPIVGGFPIDSRMAGGMLAVDAASAFESWAYRIRTGASEQRLSVDTVAGGWASTARGLAFGDAGLSLFQRPGGGTGTVSESVSGNLSGGRTFDRGWWRGVATASLGSSGLLPLPGAASLSATYAQTNTGAPTFERLQLGGSVSPLIDRVLLTQRVTMPALPAGIAAGTSVLTYRASISMQPFSPYFWAGSAAPAGSRFSQWNRVVGFEDTQSVSAIPFAGTPAARAVYGIGESLDEPFRHRLRIYASLILNP